MKQKNSVPVGPKPRPPCDSPQMSPATRPKGSIIKVSAVWKEKTIAFLCKFHDKVTRQVAEDAVENSIDTGESRRLLYILLEHGEVIACFSLVRFVSFGCLAEDGSGGVKWFVKDRVVDNNRYKAREYSSTVSRFFADLAKEAYSAGFIFLPSRHLSVAEECIIINGYTQGEVFCYEPRGEGAIKAEEKKNHARSQKGGVPLAKVEPATPSHLAAVRNLFAGLAGLEAPMPPAAGNTLRRRLQGSSVTVWVIQTDKGTVVGTFTTLVTRRITAPTVAERTILIVEDVYMSPKHRGKGYSHEMRRFLERMCHTHEASLILLSSAAHRQDAHEFWKHMGFTGWQGAVDFHRTLKQEGGQP